MTPQQCIAARKLLGWSEVQLASAALCSSATGKNLEAGRSVSCTTRTAIGAAFAAAGIILVDGTPSWIKGATVQTERRNKFGKRNTGVKNSDLVNALESLTIEAQAQELPEALALLTETLAELRGGTTGVFGTARQMDAVAARQGASGARFPET